jgi:predicted phosphodiesterase
MNALAALYDVHGNLPALEAVLAEAGDAQLVFGGDLAAGPLPAETLDRIMELDALVLRGNADRELLSGPSGGLIDEWVVGQLDDRHREYIAALPEQIELDVEGVGHVLFCHGSPRSDEEILTAITPPKRLDPILDGVLENMIVCGHTHVQFDRVVGDRRLVNAGSVGLPYEGEAGLACWALLGPDVELRRAHYDIQRAVDALEASGYPDDDGVVHGFLLEPSTAEEATAHFESVATASPTSS